MDTLRPEWVEISSIAGASPRSRMFLGPTADFVYDPDRLAGPSCRAEKFGSGALSLPPPATPSGQLARLGETLSRVPAAAMAKAALLREVAEMRFPALAGN